MMSSTTDAPNGLDFQSMIKRSYEMSTANDAKAVYSDWAKNYNAQLLDPSIDYRSPKLVAEAVAKYLPLSENLQILDAGCGTGLAGLELMATLTKDSALPGKTIVLDGCDLTPAMLEVAAETKIYRNLIQADLNKPITEAGITELSYDMVICVGTLTEGHVGPAALSEFSRITKPNGIISATVLDKVWESGGFHAEVDKLVRSGQIRILESDPHDFWKGGSTQTRVIVLKKSGSKE